MPGLTTILMYALIGAAIALVVCRGVREGATALSAGTELCQKHWGTGYEEGTGRRCRLIGCLSEQTCCVGIPGDLHTKGATTCLG